MDVTQQEMNLFPVLFSLGLFVVMACHMAAAIGFMMAAVT